jgi:hypothetical protein
VLTVTFTVAPRQLFWTVPDPWSSHSRNRPGGTPFTADVERVWLPVTYLPLGTVRGRLDVHTAAGPSSTPLFEVICGPPQPGAEIAASTNWLAVQAGHAGFWVAAFTVIPVISTWICFRVKGSPVKFEIEDEIVSKLLGSMLSGPPWRLGELTENPFAAPLPTLPAPEFDPFSKTYAMAVPESPTTSAAATTATAAALLPLQSFIRPPGRVARASARLASDCRSGGTKEEESSARQALTSIVNV